MERPGTLACMALYLRNQHPAILKKNYIGFGFYIILYDPTPYLLCEYNTYLKISYLDI
jgi:hypothetical protein